MLGGDRQLRDAKGHVGIGLQYSGIGLVSEQISHVGRGFEIEAGDEGWDTRVGLDLRRIEGEFPTPDQPRLLAEVDDFLEEALEDVNGGAVGCG